MTDYLCRNACCHSWQCLHLEPNATLQEERHPSAMGVGQSKEGFSIFGVFNKCVSPMGKRLLKLWFRRPIINLTVLNDRQASPIWACIQFPLRTL